MSDEAAATEAWLRALAGHGLPGAATAGSGILGTAPALDELLAGAARHRLVGVLAAAVDDGAVAIDREGRDRIATAHEDAMREVLLLEDELLRAVGVLDDAGVESRVLKGAALAHMVHPDPSERCFGDNDLLVPATDVDRAVAALIAAGAERRSPPLSRSFDRRFAKSVTLDWHGGTELDLHRTLAAGPYGLLVRLADLFAEPVEVILAGRALQTLPAHLHLVHGAIHLALGDVEARLGNVRDLALLAARPSVDVDAVVATARRWGCEAPVARGLRETAALGHRRTDVERWADDHTPDAVDRRRLAAYDRRDGRYRRQAVASWSVLGWRDRVAFSLALLRRRRG